MMICTWEPGKKGRRSVKGDVFVPGGNDGEAGGAAADGDLPLPLIQKSLDEREALSPAGIAEPADALDEGGFQRGAVAPALAEPFGMSALQRAAEAHTGIAHRDDYDPPAQSATEGIGLNRHPSTGAGVLHNILAGLRKRHTEASVAFISRPSSPCRIRDAPSEILSTTLWTSSDGPHRCDVEQHVRRAGGGCPGNLAVQLEEFGRLLEEAGPGPVALHLVAGRDSEEWLFPAGFGQRLPSGEECRSAVG